MPSDSIYSLADLADLADVTPRTVRYYIAQGLLPSPGQPGPGAKYGDGHLARLRLIRQLQRQHLPLAEIRARLAGLDDDTVQRLVDEGGGPAGQARVAETAADYIARVLAGDDAISPASMSPAPRGLLRRIEVDPLFAEEDRIVRPPAPPAVLLQDATHPGARDPQPSPTERSQWDRIALDPDIELHVRRPLSRVQNKRVERLIAIAREVLEETDK